MQRMGSLESIPDLLICADTIVVLDGVILEKPTSRTDAVQMLSKLSGREHVVHTAVCLVLPGAACSSAKSPFIHSFYETTKVQFSTLPAEAIEAYVDSGSPMDKAGGYGIQDNAGSFVQGIVGCYYNVTGFPLNRFCREMLQLIDQGLV